ncbi:anti-Muellerian hormone type-2 receptor isoform X2 [Hemicordylus capensis]|uniref:anti-Muellerian hormone type-2 receptor isoform X2 n=1 Tax=Hemicordylus capensis TaxID=884348 RepID=UPI002302AB82|nr:anti-Muellerian hormone type-2 receptor isoform X2 [Hemicordylus capensis]
MRSCSLLWRLGIWLLVLEVQRVSLSALVKNRSCISYGANVLTEGLEHLQGLILEDSRNSTIQCPHNQCCFGIWNRTQGGQLQAKVQGCWISEKEACNSSACESESAEDAEDTTILSCRCRSDLCNAHIKHDGPGKRQVLRLWKVLAPLLSTEEPGELTKVTTDPEGNGKRKVPRQKPPGLQFLQVLHDGQDSKLWQGTFHQQPVAIKAFAPSCYRQFASEWAVHSLPLMSHDNVIRLVAAGCGGPNEEQGGLLVLTLCPLGSLRHFLTQHTCSWDVTIRLGVSLARGLAFLHEEQWKEGLHKPGVVHRDLSSQNVLVQEDRTCVISDFGLAMALPRRHEWWREGPTEGSIRKAGAPRYTAPEILDESLNLQDLGSALKQADVYSLALVLWETLMRCSALFPDNSTPGFQLAYEMELGSNPTYCALRRLAVEERGRPVIPPVWRRIGQVSAHLQELLEDCWDPEPEARLQAECAHQRLQNLGAEDLAKEY